VCPEQQVVSIESRGARRAARVIRLDDGDEPLTTSATAARQLGLEVGDTVDRDVLAASIARLEPALAWERALRFLGYRERSVQEVRTALSTDGYASPVVEDVIERLTGYELLDDERAAALWARTRAASGIGSRRVARELALHGVAQEIIARVCDEYLASANEIDRARAQTGEVAHDAKSRSRAVRKLVRRGFDLDTAMAATADEAQDADGV
jgi:regulatory protein